MRLAFAPLTLLLVLGGLTAAAGAQAEPETLDPRSVPDPRDVPDPRGTPDPRETGTNPYEGLEGPKLFDALYESDDDVRLAEALRESQWSILSYVDGHCERWLAMVERGRADTEEGRQAMAQEQAKGRKLARLADQALTDSRFTAYVDAFYGWTADQQREFRRGQARFGEGLKMLQASASPGDALSGLGPLRDAHEIARSLGDTWGQSMALARIGRVEADNAQDVQAKGTMAQAVALGRQIRDLDAVWEGLSVRFEVAMRTRQKEEARQALQEQYLIAKDLGDEATAKQVLDRLLLLEAR